MNEQKDTIKKLQLDDLLNETDYIVTDEEVKQAFKNRGFINYGNETIH